MPKPLGAIPQIPALSGTPSANPASGSLLLYFKSDGLLYKKDSGGIEAAVDTTGGSSSSAPAGSIQPYAGIITPTGWLDCDGSAVSRTTYATLWQAVSFEFTATRTSGSPNLTVVSMSRGALANIITGMPISGVGIPAGTTVSSVNTGTSTIVMSANASASSTGQVANVAPYGIGDGSTTFNLPDTRARMLLGEASNVKQGADEGVVEAQRSGNFNHQHNHTATTSDPGVTAGTPAGTIVGASAGTPAGTIGDHASHTHGPGTYGTDPAGGFTTAISIADHPVHKHPISTAIGGLSIANESAHTHVVSFVGATNTTASGSSSRVTVINGVSVTATTQNTNTQGNSGHSHGVNAGSNTDNSTAAQSHSVTQHTEPSHSHSLGLGVSAGPSAVLTHTFTGTALPTHAHTFTGSALAAHSHTLTTTVANNTVFYHPYVAVAYIIKT